MFSNLMRSCAPPHIITDITEDYILDQAASSSLRMALLIVQVAWFCANCASMLFQGLSRSLLLVSTTAHAFCTLLTYFVWWSKPINVATPTSMREKEAREVYALLKWCMKRQQETLRYRRDLMVRRKLFWLQGQRSISFQSKRMASRKNAASRGSGNNERTMDSELIDHPPNIMSL